MENQKKDLGSRATEATVNFVPAFAGIAARLLDEASDKRPAGL
ncbi:hypothetical protein ACU8L2_31530 (plasmid) [Rhizobium leguminosarum]